MRPIAVAMPVIIHAVSELITFIMTKKPVKGPTVKNAVTATIPRRMANVSIYLMTTNAMPRINKSPKIFIIIIII